MFVYMAAELEDWLSCAKKGHVTLEWPQQQQQQQREGVVQGSL